MNFLDSFAIPDRPKLKFGEPLDVVCRDGIFHAGLKDLFLKAYLCARGDDATSGREEPPGSRASAVLQALKSGRKGQGSLARRMALKDKLESGEWLVAAQRVPPGAPLWLLRHLLGRLPRPLLHGPQWREAGRACGALLSSPAAARRACVEGIAASTRALKQVEYEFLALLALLIRNLCLEKRQQRAAAGAKEELREDVLNALGQYFIASVIARPFRPGLYTASDKECQPLLAFLAKHWHDVFEAPQAIVSDFHGGHALHATSRPSTSGSLDSYERFPSDDQRPSNYIGFERLVIDRLDDEESKKNSANNVLDIEKCLSTSDAIDDSNVIKSDDELQSSRNNFRVDSRENLSASHYQVNIVDGDEVVSEKCRLKFGNEFVLHNNNHNKVKNYISKFFLRENRFSMGTAQEDLLPSQLKDDENNFLISTSENEFFSMSSFEDSQ